MKILSFLISSICLVSQVGAGQSAAKDSLQLWQDSAKVILRHIDSLRVNADKAYSLFSDMSQTAKDRQNELEKMVNRAKAEYGMSDSLKIDSLRQEALINQ